MVYCFEGYMDELSSVHHGTVALSIISKRSKL